MPTVYLRQFLSLGSKLLEVNGKWSLFLVNLGYAWQVCGSQIKMAQKVNKMLVKL